MPFEAFEATGALPKNLVATEWWQRVVEMPKEVLETRRFHGDLMGFHQENGALMVFVW